jgi:hypothetical protein
VRAGEEFDLEDDGIKASSGDGWEGVGRQARVSGLGVQPVADSCTVSTVPLVGALIGWGANVR